MVPEITESSVFTPFISGYSLSPCTFVRVHSRGWRFPRPWYCSDHDHAHHHGRNARHKHDNRPCLIELNGWIFDATASFSAALQILMSEQKIPLSTITDAHLKKSAKLFLPRFTTHEVEFAWSHPWHAVVSILSSRPTDTLVDAHWGKLYRIEELNWTSWIIVWYMWCRRMLLF